MSLHSPKFSFKAVIFLLLPMIPIYFAPLFFTRFNTFSSKRCPLVAITIYVSPVITSFFKISSKSPKVSSGQSFFNSSLSSIIFVLKLRFLLILKIFCPMCPAPQIKSFGLGENILTTPFILPPQFILNLSSVVRLYENSLQISSVSNISLVRFINLYSIFPPPIVPTIESLKIPIIVPALRGVEPLVSVTVTSPAFSPLFTLSNISFKIFSSIYL